jgi:filamentous hemagglutinin family protein
MDKVCRLTIALGIAASLRGAIPGTMAATLPQPCTSSACTGGAFGTTGFVSAGQATLSQSGSKLTVRQASTNATLNWRSFNISADGTVQFVQPGATSVALNQIHDANATQIFGALNANGRVFLINQNGIIFGAGAQVSVGGLVASTLNINPLAVTNGLIAPGSNGNAAFQAFTTGTTGAVNIDAGASLKTSSGGQILVFAPTVTNQGTIATPDGQTLLAAGSTIYLATSSDPSLRGLLVEIGDDGGTVTNGTAADASVTSPAKLVGQIIAERGNVTLAGLAVNQLGRVSATTSINENGSIRLQAADHGLMAASGVTGVSGIPEDGTGGNLVLGAHSDTEVTLDTADKSTTVDSVPQLKSAIDMTGYDVEMLADSTARATSGAVDVTAAQQAANTGLSDGSRFYLAPGATIDVSGATAVLPVSANVIPVQLRGSELANSPLQQNGPLRSQTVYVDIRTGTPIADVSGEIAAIGHNVVERNLAGGSVSIHSNGDAILAPGSKVDVAGGQIEYTAGYLDTTKLVAATGQVFDIGSANPDVVYTGIINPSVSDPKWGVSKNYQSIPETYEAGYVEGKDAGTLILSAPQFILDGSVNTSTISGIYQRQPDQSIAAGTLYRPYNQVPLAASLVIGNSGNPGSDFVVDNVTLSPSLVLPGLSGSGGTFDPLTDPLPASYTSSVLRPDLLGPQGFGNVSIYANGKVLIPAGAAVDLPAGGSFSAVAGIIDIEGSIDAPGGSITATAEFTGGTSQPPQWALTLGPHAVLDARGEWVNDSPLLYPDGNSAPLYINGGQVSLSSLSNASSYSPGVLLARGSTIDVSAGAQLTRTGALDAGIGGSIAIAAQTTTGTLAGAPPRVDFGATVRGFALFDGGSLSLTSGAICVAVSNCSGQDPATLWVSPAELEAGGFASYKLSADQGGLSVAPGTTIKLEQQNWMLPNGYSMLANAPTLEAPTIVLPDQLRQPVSLSLAQNMPLTENFQLSSVLDVTDTTPSLTIGAGATILADPLAQISLESNVRILDDGIIRAPAGAISMALQSNLLESTYNASQAIWLGPQGILDVSGSAQIYLNGLGQRTGEVLPGGSISLTAGRGFAELLPGSVIDVAGTSGVVDETAVGGGPVRSLQVASAGGSVSLTAAEGIAVGSRIEAEAGVAGKGLEQPAGGIFSLTLDGSNRGDYFLSFGGTSTFSSDPRQIIVSATQPPVVVGLGDEVPSSLEGTAYISTSALTAAGFDSVSLHAATLPIQGPQGLTNLPGTIAFMGNVSLNTREYLDLDAASYSVSSGATARVSAPYVEMGNSEQSYDNVSAALASIGTGTLAVSGGFIELYGTSALENIGTARFQSTGDLRFLGQLDLAQSLPTALDGALYMAGALTMAAQQIYPATLSQFLISADPSSVSSPTAGSILIQGGQGKNDELLSAGGSLTLSAGNVTQDGVLRAPFGSIDIEARSIVLGAGSLTSTSADGATIPFGTTQGGIEWVYPLPNGTNVVYGTNGAAPPAQRVTLQGAQVNVSKGAVIDVSGGGDLQAYEWVDGTGGTNDVLSNQSANGGRPIQFAILPGLAADIAPFDPNISAGSTLAVGDAVHLDGAPGLPPGTYQLLPARYALLPGAYLVTEVSGYQDIRSGQSYSVLGGGTIVGGYQTVAGTSFGDSRTSGFEVVPAAVVLTQAQYTTTGANSFFSSQASAAAAPLPRLPRDSGVLALIASDALTLGGTLRTDAPSGGIGAEVDVSSADIVVGPAGTATQPGQILLTASSLNALNAQTLLLGGLNSDGGITTTAQSLEIAGGAALSAPSILLTGLDQVTVDDGAAITASGSAPGARTFTLSGDGAFLAVSAGAQSTVNRSNAAGGTGILNLAAGSKISAADGSVYLEASDNVITSGTLSLKGADLAVQSPNIILGAAPSGTVGTVLGSNILDAQGLGSLELESGSSIAVYGPVRASAQNFDIDAAGIAGFGAAGNAATLAAADTFTLTNLNGAPASLAGTGSGTLAISATDIDLGGGQVALSGFTGVALSAAHSLVASNAAAAANAPGNPGGGSSTPPSPANNAAGLGTAGNLTVTAARITADADEDLSLSATGAVALLAPASHFAPAAQRALGGSLSVTGSSIVLATSVVLPSGRVSLTTTGGPSGGELALRSGSSIDVAGVVQAYDGVKVASPGGTVILDSAGNLDLAPGSNIDVSAGTGGSGGSLQLTAASGSVTLGGMLKGSGGAGVGGSFGIDAQSFGNFAALERLLTAGGFTGGWDVHQRGAGDLTLASGSLITAHEVSLDADRGNIVIDGRIDASGAQGGSVTLAASNDVTVNGTIDASAGAAGQRGGAVSLETTGGGVLLGASSIIDVTGGGAGEAGTGTGGTVLLRVPGAAVAALAAGGGDVAMNGHVLGSTRTTLEAFFTTDNTTGTIAAADITDLETDPANPINAAATNLMANAAAITSRLGQSSNGAFVLEPGVEIDATTQSNGTGTLELDDPWNLYTWRFGSNGNVPGVLTLRAQNGITFNASLSDGFAATSGTGAFTLPTTAGDSWSYRIVAGADFSAANALATSNAAPANVTVAACSVGCSIGTAAAPDAAYSPIMVRTGNGFIDVAASGDLVFGSQQSVLYTAGVAGTGISLRGAAGTLQSRAYPTGGGDIGISVSNDIVGAQTNQFVSSWLWRVGSVLPTGSATAWTVDFRSFQQGIGALGGGNVSIAAGGNVSDLSVSIPTIGVQVGGKTAADSVVSVTGGGDLAVTAGGSIIGGSYYVGRGAAVLQAGADVGLLDQSQGGTGVAPVIGLGDASLSVTARGNLSLGEILNPTLLNRGALQGGGGTIYFSTYGDDSAATLTAIGGKLLLDDENGAFEAQVAASFLGGHLTNLQNSASALDNLPPTLNAFALSGDLDIQRTLILSPSPQGNLQAFAAGNVVFQAGASGNGGEIILSDADPTSLPTVTAPQSNLQIYDDIGSSLLGSLADQHAVTPVHLASDQAGAPPARIVAASGDVDFQPSLGGAAEGIWSAIPVHVSAGRDITDLNLAAQNLSTSDVTSVTAGRDIVYPQAYGSSGFLLTDNNAITVDGPGMLEVTAGRNVDLGTSAGITTRANLVNPVLPGTGAGIDVQAGVAAGSAQYATFIQQYIEGSSEFNSELVAFVEDIDGAAGLSAAAAKTRFAAMEPGLQRVFVEQVFFDLLRIYGSKEAASGNGDYSGAFAAISKLFPGANPAKGQANPYGGSISLYFSRVYTQQGGNISLLAPGGDINVGLALAPTSFGIDKSPDQLGIVAQTTGTLDAFSYSDFEVNQSRVFAADGGDILVWSTDGNIDAGRGAKTAISAPALSIEYDANGEALVNLRAAIAGSGIQALTATPGVPAGNVYLFAPHGVVNANDAGIVAGNLTVAATAVLGTNNISVSGTSVGVPVTVTGLGAAFAGASSTAAATSNVAESLNAAGSQSSTPVADAAINWLDVFVTGLGEENCKPDDMECLKRQAVGAH